MKKYFLLIVLLPFFGSSIHAQQADTTGFFEGYVEYAATYESMIPGVTANELRDRMGQLARVHFKKGNIKWVHNDDLGYLKSYSISSAATKETYGWSDSSPDTIYAMKLDKPRRMLIDSIVERGSEQVLDRDCIKVGLIGSAVFDNVPDPYPMHATYSFCRDIKINPDWYKYYKELRWDEVTKAYKSVALKIVIEYPGLFAITYTATGVHWEKQDESLFKPDRTKVIKKSDGN